MITIDLSDEVLIVTGSAGSIGSAIATRLAEAGAQVIGLDKLNLDLPDQLKDLRYLAEVADITDESELSNLFLNIEKKFGKITGLVNAAGLLRTGLGKSMELDSWNQIFAVNVTGTFLASKYAIPALERNGGGSIINISSVSAFVGSSGGAAYSATKGAVLSYSFGLAGELANLGIRVNAVCPGWVEGGFTDKGAETASDKKAYYDGANSAAYLNRMARPQEIADAVVWLTSPMASYVTGSALFVDGGFMIKK